jgi:hypothetical protein
MLLFVVLYKQTERFQHSQSNPPSISTSQLPSPGHAKVSVPPKYQNKAQPYLRLGEDPPIPDRKLLDILHEQGTHKGEGFAHGSQTG